MAAITGAHHIAFTVSDADRSAAWYCDLLGMQVVLDGDDDTVRFRVLAHPSGWFVGVRQYPERTDRAFDEYRTGLDHFAFAVASRQDLESWEGELERRGISFTPIAETPIGSVIAFRDPDNIQLEFFCQVGASGR
jgi:glyoxylase I family protein